MAMVRPEYEFLYVEVGANGRNSDRGIWNRCELKKAIEKGTLNLPAPQVLPDRNCKITVSLLPNETIPMKNL